MESETNPYLMEEGKRIDIKKIRNSSPTPSLEKRRGKLK
jgi:hypothetical protein